MATQIYTAIANENGAGGLVPKVNGATIKVEDNGDGTHTATGDQVEIDIVSVIAGWVVE